MLRLAEGTEIYVATNSVDFRKAINGLAALVIEQFETPLNDGSVYVFYNAERDKVKCVNQHAKMTPLGGKTASKIDPPLRCNITAG